MGLKSRTCRVEGCDQKHKSKGLCSKHYQNLRRIGQPVPVRSYERRSGVRREATDTERAYIAGYFDGEGCVTIAPRDTGGYYVRVDFGQTNPTAVIFMESIYGGALAESPARKPNQRPQTRYRLARAASVRKFLEDIAPFCREKQEQVNAVLSRFFVPNPVDVGQLIADLSAMKRRIHGSHAAA